jgi:hypothetical protein
VDLRRAAPLAQPNGIANSRRSWLLTERLDGGRKHVQTGTNLVWAANTLEDLCDIQKRN